MFTHEKTRIYSRALELTELAMQIIQRLPSGCGFLADQLRRASSSVVFNFVEGYAHASKAEQRRYFRIARGSACESAAIVDVALRFEAIPVELHARTKDVCDHLVAMLVRFRRE